LVLTLELTPLSSRAAQLPDATPAPGGSGVRDNQTLLRIRAEVADRLVNQAGELSIARSRVETEMEAFEHGLSDLAVTTGRVREQLHEIDIQAESSSRVCRRSNRRTRISTPWSSIATRACRSWLA
jgi:chemotaxis protein histidine kinase CheA